MGRIWASIALAVTIGTAACAPDAPPTAQAGARSETPEAIRLGTSRAALTATLPRILWQDDFAGNCVCGTGYSGFSAQTPKSFADPVPAGNCVTGVQVDFGGTGCGSSPDFFVNGADLGTTGVPNSCNCGNCDAATVTFTNPAGIPGYVYGGTNSLTFTDSGGGYALSYTDLTLTYGPGASATTTTLASGSNPSVFGQSVALTAHVASGSPSPTAPPRSAAPPSTGRATPRSRRPVSRRARIRSRLPTSRTAVSLRRATRPRSRRRSTSRRPRPPSPRRSIRRLSAVARPSPPP
jgi:hypothetical protein